MKPFIVFSIATLTFAIPAKRSWTEKRYNQEIEPLQAEIQQDVNENVKDELFDLIFNSTYSEKQEFRNEISEMNSDEKLYLTKNLEFILNGNVSFNYDDEYDENKWDSSNDPYYQSEISLGDFDDAKGAMKNDAIEKDAMKNEDFEKNAPMTSTERFDLPDDRKMHSNEVLEIPMETYNKGIIVLAILSFFMVIIIIIRLLSSSTHGIVLDRDVLHQEKKKIECRNRTHSEFKTKTHSQKNCVHEDQS